ncbi:MAG: type II toxin-antitoxin system VapC family toxin, partial [Myxococcota bacterium]|nr:type II toxin-antitoxin system VapC family toxin [Myxococcota bacterium]
MQVFLDSNVFLYAAGADHPHKVPCVEIVRAVSEGRLKANTSAEVVQEILYVYLRRGLREEAVRLAGHVAT